MSDADWALTVGVRLYPDLTDLDGPENDANAFHKWVLAKTGGDVPEKQAKLIISSQYAAKVPPPFASGLDAKPTRDEIERFFFELLERGKKNSEAGAGLRVGRRLYLYFAGHGIAPGKFIGEEESDDAAVFMANASRDRPGLHIAGKAWADRMYFSGYFDEVILFMDCCRDSYPQIPLIGPTVVKRTRTDQPAFDGRFYAFGTKWARQSWERQMSDGQVHGVFTQTLLDALQNASHPQLGHLTAGTLKSYLYNNFRSFLAPEDIQNPDVPKEPDVFFKGNDDAFVIVNRAVQKFPITFTISPVVVGKPVKILDGGNKLAEVERTPAATATWTVALPRSTYLLQIDGDTKVTMFEVTGTGPQDVSV